MKREFVYDAFISYRYANPDKAIAVKLQKLLEKYNPPASIKSGRGFKKLRLFRDETELSASPNLSEDIKAALQNSRFLIVLCSKTISQSDWCLQEINYFKELHGGSTDNIITVLTEGDPSDGFPLELSTKTRTVTAEDGTIHIETINIEPLVANISAATEKESLKKLKREYLRIVAPLLGCGFDDLYKRNQRRLVRRIITVATALVLFLAGFGTYSSAMAYQISTQRDQLEQKTTELESKTVELNETNTELSQKNDELDSANSQLEQTNDDLEQTNIDLAAKTAEAEENLVYANAQKAEAEKNLEYANQQKVEAEQNLEYANQQKAEAERNLVYANEQKELAEINEANTKKANYELRIKTSDILATQAQMYLDDDYRVDAIKAAIEALPADENDDLPVNTTAEYILSQTALVYTDAFRLMRQFVDTSGYIAGLKYCNDGSKLLAYDTSNNIYLIDTDNNKVTKTYSVVNDFHVIATSSEIIDIVMEDDYAYILYSGGLACINPIAETICWYVNGLSSADMIKTNRSSDIIAVKTRHAIYFINKNGVLLEEFSETEYSEPFYFLDDIIWFSYLDKYVAFVDESGCLYICTEDFSDDTKQSLLRIDPYKKTVDTYSLNLDNLLFMAELDDNIIISSGTKYEGKIVCYNKSDLKVKWETEYDSGKEYLSKYVFNRIIRYNSVKLISSEEEQRVLDVICVISGSNIVSVDYKTGDLVTSYNASSAIKGLCYTTSSGFWAIGADGLYLCSVYSISFDSYFPSSFPSSNEYMAYGDGGGDRFALAGRNSSRIDICKIVKGDNIVELVGSDSNGYDFFTENSYGVIAYFDDNPKNNTKSVKVYDTNKQEKNAEVFLDNDVICLKFVNADNLVICDREGSMFLYDIRGRLLNQMNLVNGITDYFQLSYAYISFYKSSTLVSNKSNRFIYQILGYVIYIDITSSKLNIEKIIACPETDAYSSDHLVQSNFEICACVEEVFVDNKQDKGEYLHSKIRYVNKYDEVFYVLDGENEFTYNGDDVSDLSISSNGEIIAFIKTNDYVGVYSTKDKSLRKIKISAGDAIPKFATISPDDRYLLALCHNGSIIRYSLEDLSVSDQIKTEFDMSLPFLLPPNVDFKFIDDNEVTISFEFYTIFINYETMEVRAEMDYNYVGFMPSSRKIITSKYNIESKCRILNYYKYLTTEELIESAKRFANIE